ncbi:MAG: hypothetical protein LC797_12205, partial [Chloroflexi bacterium]|nr:hypothetical protein [Chloroflexota bacterium]
VKAPRWLTSGATGLARGLNDTPKILAIGALALVPSGGGPRLLVGAIAILWRSVAWLRACE